jgi:hypothetical protein
MPGTHVNKREDDIRVTRFDYLIRKNLLHFHDHEEFNTFFDIKLFVIMKDTFQRGASGTEAAGGVSVGRGRSAAARPGRHSRGQRAWERRSRGGGDGA